MKRLPRRLLVTSLSFTGLLALALLSHPLNGQQFAPDPERAFSFGDTDLNGKLTLAEFRELVQNGARQKQAIKKAPPNIESLFRRLDTNADGELTVAEYRAIVQIRQGMMGPVGPIAKQKVAARKPETPKPAEIAAFPDKPITAEQLTFFESKIRPVLATKCAQCHSSSAKDLKGGLLVDTKESLRKGGENGPAIVPGDVDGSLLIKAIRYHDDSLQMPPKKKLDDNIVADFESWIKMGAPDPRVAQPLPSTSASSQTSNEKRRREFWAFQPLKSTPAPKVKNTSWPRSDIDRFILAGLEAKKLKPVADADRHALIRRVTFDLIGLPPTPEQVTNFINDQSPDAFVKVVDRLLASPRFGERWGRHWLDVARYAESSGKANMLYSNAWRYRDWVIAAFNSDKPFGSFIKEQIAGDLLPAKNDQDRAEKLIATGFLALGSKIHNTQNRKQFVLDLVDEQIEVTSHAFLGLTIACARCHDHKFDPISQRDYYALAGVFQSTQTCYGTLPGLIQNINPSPLIELPTTAKLPTAMPPLPAPRRQALEKQVADLIAERNALTPDENMTPKGFQTRARLAITRFRLASYRPDGTPRHYAMGVQERFEPINSPLYQRGELEHPSDIVPRGIVPVTAPTAPSVSHGSGRLELAEWLASSENPLPARVMVNRVWLHLFGRGLVASPDNFGAAGQSPSHPELLDTLALSLRDHNGSIKSLIRQIVLSRTYQLASTHDDRNQEIDPDNTLVWRMSPKRLEAEALRDAVLAVSGRLIIEPRIGSAVATAGEGLAGPFRNFGDDNGDQHRAVYLTLVRDQLPESLTLFDFGDPSVVTDERATTNGPSQSLYLMNNTFIIRLSEVAARQLLKIDDDQARIKAAYLRFLAREPTPAERTRAAEFLNTFHDGGDTSDRLKSAWTAFCQALFGSAEFRYLD